MKSNFNFNFNFDYFIEKDSYFKHLLKGYQHLINFHFLYFKFMVDFNFKFQILFPIKFENFL